MLFTFLFPVSSNVRANPAPGDSEGRPPSRASEPPSDPPMWNELDNAPYLSGRSGLSEPRVAGDTYLPMATEDNSLKERLDRSWYRDWRFWTLAGVVVAGVAVAYLGLNQSRVETTGSPLGPR